MSDSTDLRPPRNRRRGRRAACQNLLQTQNFPFPPGLLSKPVSAGARGYRRRRRISSTVVEESIALIHSLERENSDSNLSIETLFKEQAFPHWDHIPAKGKQLLIMTGIGVHKDAVAITANLSPKIEDAARASQRGPGDFVGQIIRRALKELELEDLLSLVCEFSETDRLHIHGVMRIPESKRCLFVSLLKKRLSAHYVEIGKNKAILLEPIWSAAGWASYSVKDQARTSKRIRSPFYNSHPATNEGKRFLKHLRELPKAQSQATLPVASL